MAENQTTLLRALLAGERLSFAQRWQLIFGKCRRRRKRILRIMADQGRRATRRG